MADATLVYDDDCGFCTWWARALERRADIRLVGFSELTDDVRERLPADYEECAHLLVDGEVYSCGESIERAFEYSDIGDDAKPALDFLRQFDEYGDLRERAYRVVADNRDFFGKIISADPPARGGSAGDD
jgi:predicted DCC family thiol-disulfide oxidoreductase YuxK